MSERNRFSSSDSVRRLVDGIRQSTETVVESSKDAADSALDISRDVTSAVVGLGKKAVNVYIDTTMRAIDKTTNVIKDLGVQVLLLPDEVKERLFGKDEPSLGDRPTADTKD